MLATEATFLDRRVDLTAEPMPVSYAIEGFAAHGLLTLLAGETRAGKTWLALQGASGVAESQESRVIGLPCHPGRALYLDAENGPMVVQDRERTGALGLAGVTYLDMNGARLDREGDRDRLTETIRQVDATFVVIDSLTRLRGPLRENDTDDMAMIVGGLASVARQTGAAIVLLHHQSTKSNAAAVRGSSAIEDQSDIVFVLDKGRGQDRRLVCRKFRIGAERPPIPLTLLSDPVQLAATGGSRQASLQDQLTSLEGQVSPDGWLLAKIGHAVGLDTSQDGDRQTLTRALRKLTESGAWTKPAHGKYAPRS